MPEAIATIKLPEPQIIGSTYNFRLFHNNIAEVVAEALQNSQRAGAKNVEISITPDGFSITDDSHGLLGGIDGFHTLLKLAESAFDNPTIADQDPMGVGIVSLIDS